MSMKNLNTVVLTVVVMFATLNVGLAQKSKLPKVQYQVQGNGIPASPKQINYKQPDGSFINITLKGDAAVHWAISDDGYTLLSNSNGFYEYAKLDEKGDLISTGVNACNAENRKSNEIAILQSVPKGISYSEKQIKQRLSNFKTSSKGGQLKSFPSTGAQNFLVLMVEFQDLSFTNSVTDFDNLMNQSNYGGIGSFKDFYFENSNGKLTINTLVDGIYQAPNNHDYYGQNDGSGDDMNVGELVSELILGADAYIDFSQFDNDGDGVVDAVYVIYAGTGEASSANPNDIWPHASSITPITVDGVSVEKYACSNELNGTSMAGIGTICHEFGHSLGLPDYYDTDYAGSGGQAEGTGSWDVMAGGNSNGNEASPANHNPVSKELLGWQYPEIIDANGSYILPPATQDTIAFLIEASSANEGFYLENRQWESFDYELQEHGMLIYHCDFDYFMAHMDANDINADPSHQGFDIEEADDEASDETGDTYPGTTSNTTFTDNTYPNSVLWSGSNLGYPIVNIVENSTTDDIEFDISGFTGINDIVTNNNIQLYPTIANDFINVKSDKTIQEISIINLQGQLIFESRVNNLHTRLNVSNINAGTYFIKSKTADCTAVSKIIVVH
jgi:M6 family metalloprotease-like protein